MAGIEALTKIRELLNPLRPGPDSHPEQRIYTTTGVTDDDLKNEIKFSSEVGRANQLAKDAGNELANYINDNQDTIRPRLGLGEITTWLHSEQSKNNATAIAADLISLVSEVGKKAATLIAEEAKAYPPNVTYWTTFYSELVDQLVKPMFQQIKEHFDDTLGLASRENLERLKVDKKVNIFIENTLELLLRTLVDRTNGIKFAEQAINKVSELAKEFGLLENKLT